MFEFFEPIKIFDEFFFLVVMGKDTTFPRNFQGFREKYLKRGRRTKKIGDSRN